MKLLDRIAHYFNRSGKIKAMIYLRSMSADQLVNVGFSPELLKQGIDAWPWREDQLPDALSEIERKIIEEKRCVRELQSLTDAELRDLGISRGTIVSTVRHGRPGIDPVIEVRDQNSLAA